MRKRTVIVISVLCVYLCAMSASFLLLFNGKYEKRDYKYDSRYSSVEYFSIHSTGGISGDYDDLVNFSTGCHEAFESTASRIALAGALDKNNEEIAGLLEDYQQIRVGSQIMYYQVQTTEEYIYVGLVDTDTNSYYCTCVSNVEKARKKEPDDVYRHDRNETERIYDIIGLMTGRDLSKNKFYMAATIETLVFVSAIAVVLAKGRKRSKKQSDGSDNQTT